MRVIAGVARSLKLEVPEGKGVRPTTDRIKETLFNMMNQDLYGSSFLDVFAGSGAIGIEALSRGAKEAVFIENNQKALQCVERNLKHTKLLEKATIYKSDVIVALDGLKRNHDTFDLIFLDPPYDNGYEEKAICKIYDAGVLAEDGYIVCESSAKTTFEFIDTLERFEIYKEKHFRTTKLTFIRYSTFPPHLKHAII